MYKLILGAAAAAIVTFATPSFAQVHVEGGHRGVDVRVGHDRGWHNGWRNRDAYARGNCRVEVTRIRRANGTMITKRERRCR